jgi:hypothetical protein
MSKRKTKKRDASALPQESRAAEAVTVAWMMSALAAFLGTALSTISYAALFFTARDGRITTPMVTIPFLLFFISGITGAICLLLTPVALKLRRSPPPKPVTIFAVFFGAAPLIAAIVLAVVY